MLDALVLAQQCAPTVSPPTMVAILHVESNLNPYAIGVVGGRLTRQPDTADDAIATARALEAANRNFSVGIAQINRHNLDKYALTYEQAFDPCANVRVAAKILEDRFVRAKQRIPAEQAALRTALSCYYSGNFTRGFRPDTAGKPSYVQKVLAQAGTQPKAIAVVPSIVGETTNHRSTAPSTAANLDAPVLLAPASGRDPVRLQPALPEQPSQQTPATATHAPTRDMGSQQRTTIVF